MQDLLSQTFEVRRKNAADQMDVEMGQPPVNPADMGMEDFFKQVRDIERQIERISEQLQKLQDLNEDTKTITKASAMKAIKLKMEREVDEVGKIARSVKSKLEEIDRDNLSNRSKPGCEKGSGVDRSRMSMTVSLKKKLKERMSEFQALRQQLQEEYREVVERRVFTVTGTRPDEETIDRLIETGKGDQIFQKAIQEHGRGQVMDTLAEIQERHDAVRDLEKKLLDLQQVFMDMAVLVEAQGDLLDSIEAQVSNAVNYVQSGTATLQKAKSLQKSSRKWMCIAIIILLVIIVIIVLAVVKPWDINKKTT